MLSKEEIGEIGRNLSKLSCFADANSWLLLQQLITQAEKAADLAKKLKVADKNSARWLRVANKPETAKLLGTQYHPTAAINWVYECNKLIDGRRQ